MPTVPSIHVAYVSKSFKFSTKAVQEKVSQRPGTQRMKHFRSKRPGVPDGSFLSGDDEKSITAI